jgi:hypothetical protein
MKTKLFPFYFLVMMIVMVTSCRKTPVVQPAPIPTPVINALAKVERNGGDYDSLYYNSDLQLIKLIQHTNTINPYDLIYTFEYDANKKMTRLNVGSEHYDYVYINGVLGGVNHYINSSTKSDYRIFDYTDGKLTGYEEYYQLNNSPAYDFAAEAELEYYPDGNLKSETIYSFAPQTRARYKHFSFSYSNYDTKNNAAAMLNRFVYFAQVKFQKNNPGTMIARYEAGGFEIKYDFTYTYNDFSNPLMQVMTGNGTATTATYHYY